MTAELKCRICACTYTTTINSLSEPIDVYSEWLDETDERQKEGLTRREYDGDDGRRVRRRVEE